MKNLTWQNPEQLFVAQVLINKVKSKCCGIKVLNKTWCSYIMTSDSFSKSAWHPQNGFLPTATTLLGILILLRELQLKKVPSPILITLFGIFMLVRELHSPKVTSSILVILFGILMFLRDLQPAKA